MNRKHCNLKVKSRNSAVNLSTSEDKVNIFLKRFGLIWNFFIFQFLPGIHIIIVYIDPSKFEWSLIGLDFVSLSSSCVFHKIPNLIDRLYKRLIKEAKLWSLPTIQIVLSYRETLRRFNVKFWENLRKVALVCYSQLTFAVPFSFFK